MRFLELFSTRSQSSSCRFLLCLTVTKMFFVLWPADIRHNFILLAESIDFTETKCHLFDDDFFFFFQISFSHFIYLQFLCIVNSFDNPPSFQLNVSFIFFFFTLRMMENAENKTNLSRINCEENEEKKKQHLSLIWISICF